VEGGGGGAAEDNDAMRTCNRYQNTVFWAARN
jgi:hypothetical protein